MLNGEQYLQYLRRQQISFEMLADGRIALSASGYLEAPPIPEREQAAVGTVLGMLLMLRIATILIGQFGAEPLILGNCMVLGRLKVDFPSQVVPTISFEIGAPATLCDVSYQYHFYASMVAGKPAALGAPAQGLPHAAPFGLTAPGGAHRRSLADYLQALEQQSQREDGRS